AQIRHIFLDGYGILVVRTETKAGKRLFLPQRKDDVVQAGRERPTYDTYVIETVDSNVIPDHSDMYNNEFENDQNADDHDEDELRFGNDQFVLIIGYGDLVQGNVTIKRVYYAKGLNHNLFFVGQLCYANMEVAFRKSTCYIRDLQGNDLLMTTRGSNLYTLALQESSSPTPIYFLAKASPT
nr:integrase, catalytic region, zinc finger, CCHC-type, peptidase aspartic, catalytic [Tanacetum cinerariifolium]